MDCGGQIPNWGTGNIMLRARCGCRTMGTDPEREAAIREVLHVLFTGELVEDFDVAFLKTIKIQP